MPVVLTHRTVGRLALVAIFVALVGVGIGVWAAWIAPVDRHLRRAEEALHKQRYAPARAELQVALRYQPDNARLHLLAGRTARRANDLPAAREHLRLCRELQGVSEEQQLEEYLLRAQTGEVDEVHRFLVPYLIQEGPLTPLVLEALVRAYMGRYRVEAAIGCLTRWLDLEPDNVEALFRRGTWYAQQQNTKAAVTDYRRVLELDPERTEVRLLLAELLRADRQFAEVEEQYRAVLGHRPGDPAALIGLAQCFVETGREPAACALIDQLPEDQQAAADPLWVRGVAALHKGQLEAAADLLRRAVARQPRHRDACYSLMICLSRLGRTEESRAAAARFATIEQDEARLVAITTREMNESPRNPNLHCELGEIYLRLGVAERGLHWLRSALRIDPGCRRAHEQLRDYFDGLGPPGKEQAAVHRQHLAAPH